METNLIKLPSIHTLNQCNGDFSKFEKKTYAVFIQDFVTNKPLFCGKALRLKSKPYIDGKEYTYYHFTHDGDIEPERLPNIRRMERIVYPSPMINHSLCSDLMVWRNKRGRHERILIYHEEERYLVVLEDRKDYILPWTAYLVEHKPRQEKLLKEYREYIKRPMPPGNP